MSLSGLMGIMDFMLLLGRLCHIGCHVVIGLSCEYALLQILCRVAICSWPDVTMRRSSAVSWPHVRCEFDEIMYVCRIQGDLS
jgi:hypothetical protein